MVTDPVQAQQFQHMQPWSDWAREQEQDGSDTGIDLVAEQTGSGRTLHTFVTIFERSDHCSSADSEIPSYFGHSVLP